MLFTWLIFGGITAVLALLTRIPDGVNNFLDNTQAIAEFLLQVIGVIFVILSIIFLGELIGF